MSDGGVWGLDRAQGLGACRSGAHLPFRPGPSFSLVRLNLLSLIFLLVHLVRDIFPADSCSPGLSFLLLLLFLLNQQQTTLSDTGPHHDYIFLTGSMGLGPLSPPRLWEFWGRSPDPGACGGSVPVGLTPERHPPLHHPPS